MLLQKPNERLLLGCFLGVLIPFSDLLSSGLYLALLTLFAGLLLWRRSAIGFPVWTVFLLLTVTLGTWVAWASSAAVGIGVERAATMSALVLFAFAFSDDRMGPSQLSPTWWSGLLRIHFLVVLWAAVEWVWAIKGFTITHQATYDVTASFGHRNLLITYLITVSPMLLWRRFAGIDALVQRTYLVLLVWMSIGMLNRTAWLLWGIMVIVAWMVDRKAILRWVAHHRWMTVLIGAGIAMLLWRLDEWYTLLHHFEVLATFDGSIADRWRLAVHSMHMVSESPWFGSGLGSWVTRQFDYVQLGMTTDAATVFYQHPHNEYLWLAVEAGVLVGLCYLLLHLVALLKSARMIRQRPWLFLFWCGIIAVSASDAPTGEPAFLLLQALGLAWTFGGVVTATAWWKDWLVRFAAVVVLVMAVISVLGDYFLVKQENEVARQNWQDITTMHTPWYAQSVPDDQLLRPRYWKSLAFWNTGSQDSACVVIGDLTPAERYHPWEWYRLGRCALWQEDSVLAERCFKQSVSSTTTYQEGWVALAQLSYGRCAWRQAFAHLIRADVVHQNELYDSLATELAIDSLTQLADRVTHRKMQLTLLAMRNTPEWSLRVMKHAGMNGLPFSEQAYLDAAQYMIDHCEVYEDCDLVQEVVSYYLPHRIDLLTDRMNTD